MFEMSALFQNVIRGWIVLCYIDSHCTPSVNRAFITGLRVITVEINFNQILVIVSLV